MKIITKDKKNQQCLWNSELEAYVAFLSVKLEKERGLDKFKICRELNFKYLKKRPATKIKNCSPTRFQRTILNDEGY